MTHRLLIAMALLPALAAAPVEVLAAAPLHPLLEQAERRRVNVVKKLTPATVAVFDREGEGGGSGVIVNPDGLVITNFHVVAPCGPWLYCGLPDGTLSPAVVLGVDPPGDLAAIRLLDQREFPAAQIGDSNAARAGQEVFVAGNPFLLADDLRPSITHGILSGVHRYQYPAGTILEYADCLQTDAAINPGNSGGPLYDSQGRLIGVNGRGSFEKRGRVNVGVGYAISINQVMRFLSHLESGRIVDHASLGATAATLQQARVVIDQIDRTTDAYRRGLRVGDQLVSIAGRGVTSANDVQNVVATYPPGWRLPVTYRRVGEQHTALVRLARAHSPGKLEEIVDAQFAKEKKPPLLAGVHESRPGFTNFEANKRLRDRLLETCLSRTPAPGKKPWTLTGVQPTGGAATISLADDRASFASPRGEYWISPQQPLAAQIDPPGSGGLLAALSLWRTLLRGNADTLDQVVYLGRLAWDPAREPLECLRVSQGDAVMEFFFDTKTSRLAGVEYFADDASESCRVRFDGYSSTPEFPAQLTVFRGDETWLQLNSLRITTEGPSE